MSDVLDNERGPAPMWVVPVAMLAVVLVVVALAWRSGGSDDRSRPVSARSPSSSPSPVPAVALPTPGHAGGACGGDVTLPLVAPGTRPANTRLRLLVGDRDLRLVDVDTSVTRVLSQQRDGRSITALTRSSGRVLALLRNTCSPDGFGKGRVVTLDPVTGRQHHDQPGDELLPGTPATVIDYDPIGGSYLRDIDGTTRTRIRDGWAPLARRGNTYFVLVQPSQAEVEAQGVGALGTVGIGDPATATMTRPFGSGSDVAASDSKVVWLAGGCDPGPCLLATTGADGIANAQPLSGRRPWSGVISPDGSHVAFRLTRTEGRLGGHPGPPNDVAVLDIRSGKLRVLPGLVLPAKAGLTLAWSPDSTWLVLGADLGTRPLVMIWREAMERPAQVVLPATGGGTTGPPALLVLPR
jgi:hypothetical protein